MMGDEKVWRKDEEAKVIIFSQWTSMLNLLEKTLSIKGHRFVRLDGGMSQSQRDCNIATFCNDPSVKIFLISIKAGGVGLNLIVANVVFIVDPWWNAASENQAIDRVHRLGQQKPVFVFRLLIENSIEERIIELQQRKNLLVHNALGKTTKDLKQLRLEELRLLFRD